MNVLDVIARLVKLFLDLHLIDLTLVKKKVLLPAHGIFKWIIFEYKTVKYTKYILMK